MKTKTGIIKAANFNPENYSEVVRDKFQDVTQNGIEYKMIFCFEKYINEHFDVVFDTREGYEKWLREGVNKAITNVKYDWNNEKAYITIADTNFPGPHEFDCQTTWTDQDCIDAINSKFK